MSAAATTVLEPPRGARPRAPHPRARLRRTAWTLAPFALLGLYGTLRWGTMLSPDPVPRLLGMLAVALAVGGLGLWPAARIPALAAVIAPLGVLALIPLAGLPLDWVIDLRISVIVRAIGHGLAELPAVLVPYSGLNEPVRAVIAMGAGVLLLDAGLIFAFAPRALGELRLALATLPLVVLAVVPAALERPSVPYVHGALLFVLLAAVVWGERLRGFSGLAAVGLVTVAMLGAMLAAPRLDPHKPWLDFRTLAGRLGPGRGESFDWSQSYGPLRWPRTGHEVLEVQAAHPAYWKAENLETFDGYGWSAGAVQYGFLGADVGALRRFTQQLHVTDTGMSSANVIAAGVAAAPTHLGSVPVPGASTGTWVASTPLHPGDSYLVDAYTPAPSPRELRRAGSVYPAALPPGYRSISLPAAAPPPSPSRLIEFAPFRAGPPYAAVGATGEHGTARLLERSSYAPAYRLARRLAGRAATPYDYALAIKAHLTHGYLYDESPPPSRYPIASFLFGSHRGYCQQFAGAMALLLRMGGVPARVSAGFTTGTYDSSTRAYSVADVNAHAWVEAWFPHYGWVTFDPTPSVDPALGGHIRLPAAGAGAGASGHAPRPVRRPEPARVPASAAGGVGAHRGSGLGPPATVAIAAALAIAVAVLAALALRGARAAARDPLAELERAFARSGRPLAPPTTLAVLEHRYRDDPRAAGYIRAVRLWRYGGGPAGAGLAPPPRGRRALRAQLATGRGTLGRLRALWALPPAPHRSGRGRRGGRA